MSTAALKLLIYTLQNTIYLELLLDTQAYYVAHIQRLSESTLILGFLKNLLTLCYTRCRQSYKILQRLFHKNIAHFLNIIAPNWLHIDRMSIDAVVWILSLCKIDFLFRSFHKTNLVTALTQRKGCTKVNKTTNFIRWIRNQFKNLSIKLF